MPEFVQVNCKMCHGRTTACLTDIKLVVEDGDIAFMLYAEHVYEKLMELGYQVKLQYPDGQDFPIAMWIRRESWD